MIFPNNKQFAFTIIDDTDEDRIENTRPVYELLAKLGLKTTKTCWIFPSRDDFQGLSLENYAYRQYIGKLKRLGFEIALHGVGSGRFTRQDILDGLEIFRQFIGYYPKIQINHSQNPDNIYWGIKRLSLLRPLWRWSKFKGDNPESIYFWGDYHKKYIKYTRNFTFKNLKIAKADPYMPYKEKNKLEYSNYWFSASDGGNLEKFNKLIKPENVDHLASIGGLAIVYTHFASGFVRGGRLEPTFRKNMEYLARKDGWFVPASELLDWLLKKSKGKEITPSEKLKLEARWLWDKLI